jgi:hypothetical protein
MKNTTMLRLQLNETLDWLDQVVEDLTPEQYAWKPEGSANPISELHAHTLCSADFWMNLMGLQKPMVWMGISDKLGLPSNWIQIWGTTTPINLEDMQDYSRSLREASAAIEDLSDEDLAREVPAPMFGKRDASFVLRLASMQLAIHTGEISAAKGLQGLKGLPF